VNKSDLVTKLADRFDGDRRTAAAAVNGVLEEIERSLARGEKVSLTGFGTFDRRERGPRTVRNPATGATIQVGASVAPVFRAGAGLKQLLADAAGTAGGTARAAVATSISAVQAVPAAAAEVIAPAKKAGKKAASKPPKPAKGSKATSKKTEKKAAGKKAAGKTAKKG
jgi:DNA-binding protein HU-beta